MMRTRFTSYESYADAALEDIFRAKELENVLKMKADHLGTAYFEMGPEGKFTEKALPLEVQGSPVFAMAETGEPWTSRGRAFSVNFPSGPISKYAVPRWSAFIFRTFSSSFARNISSKAASA